MKWETEEEFCQWIRAKWGDAYADNLEERVEAAVTCPHHDRYDHQFALVVGRLGVSS